MTEQLGRTSVERTERAVDAFRQWATPENLDNICATMIGLHEILRREMADGAGPRAARALMEIVINA